MASLIHIAEVAALLALAYLIGWAAGYLARRLTARPSATDAVSPERLAAVMGKETAKDALVKAPVIVPVASDPPPAPPAPPAPKVEPAPPQAEPPSPQVEPVRPVTATAQATAAVEESATEATVASPGLSTTLPPVIIPAVVPPPPMFARDERAAAPLPPRAEAGPTPVESWSEPEPDVPYSAAPAMKPGHAWSGEIKGRPADAFSVDTRLPASEPELQSQPETVVAAPLVDTPVDESGPEASVEPPSQAGTVAAVVVSEVAAPEPAPPAAAVEYDEDAAMRAIEGGWSRTRARAMPGAPELADVGAAVAAAQTAVEQVLAQAGIDPDSTKHAGKPAGLPRPRPSGKDNLKQINGLSPLDESTLNNLGVYHFDQIAAWDETEVLWMENHVFARGRIGREEWQAQARTLSSIVTG